MTTVPHNPHAGSMRATRSRVRDAITHVTAAQLTFAAVRLALGWVFLWAFLDKMFGLGHETAHADAWIRDGSPTEGFLAFAAQGPFEGFYHDIAGAAWADWLFMIGLAAIGVALILGIGIRLATVAGVVMLLMMFTAVLPPENNPFMDDHIIYALALIGIALLHAERTLGLGARWQETALVKRFRWFA